MEFAWSEEQLAFRDSVVEFARRSLVDNVEERDRAGTFSRELWERCAEFGIQGLPFAEEHGGMGQDIVTTMLGMEALGYACRDQGLLFSIHAHMWSVAMPIHTFGTDAQKEAYLPKLLDGRWIGAHGMSEPDSGSDAYSLRARAERRGDRYVLNGTKMFVTNAPVADLFVVFATVDPAKGMFGVTGFVLEKGTKGLTVGNTIHKMGLTTSPMSEVILEDCEVAETCRLGAEGQGTSIFAHSMGWERACILGSTVGGMQHQLETCIKYAKSRKQFGKPIGSFQLVASKIVDLKLRLETSRLLLYRAAVSQAGGTEHAMDAALAKLYISEAAVQSALDAMQIHGGYGYTKEYGVERDLRDALGGKLYSGTSEIQRLIIARYLGLRPLS
ncbi:MAG TPA: acyl-CoA dehydrogenase family protein [Gemmatimonadales bacterium]